MCKSNEVIVSSARLGLKNKCRNRVDGSYNHFNKNANANLKKKRLLKHLCKELSTHVTCPGQYRSFWLPLTKAAKQADILFGECVRNIPQEVKCTHQP